MRSATQGSTEREGGESKGNANSEKKKRKERKISYQPAKAEVKILSV
jgi:hypothetical protein